MTTLKYEEFVSLFLANLIGKSRSAAGTSDISSTEGKRPLVKQGKELSDQAIGNLHAAAKSVWSSAKTSADLTPEFLRTLVEHWNDLLNSGLQGSYADAQKDLLDFARRVPSLQNIRLNGRYRLGIPSYTYVHPLDLATQMDGFYAGLSWRIAALDEDSSRLPETLAWIDLELDGRIHPFSDGCGRTAAALVMWTSLLTDNGRQLPHFGNRDAHYKAINNRNLQAQADYYERSF